MSETLTFRPRFKFRTPLSMEELVSKVTHHSTTSGEHIRVRKVHHHLQLSFPKSVSHFWTPHMDINLEKEPEHDQILVRCLIGPSPTVWTMFVFFYGLFGLLGLVGLIWGMSQWSLEKSMWALWLMPAALLGMGIMYFISYEGQQLSKKEMHYLKKFVDDALECDCIALSEEMND